MTSDRSMQPQPAAGQPDEELVDAVRKMLNSVQQAGQDRDGQGLNLERTAADYAAIVLRGHVENQRVQADRHAGAQQPQESGLAEAAGDLRRAVERVRAYYMTLADLEVRRMLNDALGGPAGAGWSAQASAADTAAGPDAFPPRAGEQLDGFQHAPPPEPVHFHAPLGEGPGNGRAGEGAVNRPYLFEGTVRLIVNAGGNMQRVIRFVDDLCRRPQFRMLRLEGSPQDEGAEIFVGLREPLPFQEILAGMNGVLEVGDGRAGPGGEQTVNVRLSQVTG